MDALIDNGFTIVLPQSTTNLLQEYIQTYRFTDHHHACTPEEQADRYMRGMAMIDYTWDPTETRGFAVRPKQIQSAGGFGSVSASAAATTKTKGIEMPSDRRRREQAENMAAALSTAAKSKTAIISPIAKHCKNLLTLVNKVTNDRTKYFDYLDAMTKVCTAAEADEAMVSPQDWSDMLLKMFDMFSSNQIHMSTNAQLFVALVSTFNSTLKPALVDFVSTLQDTLYHQVERVNSEEDYDKFCEMNKWLDVRKKKTHFLLAIMKEHTELITETHLQSWMHHLFATIQQLLSSLLTTTTTTTDNVHDTISDILDNISILYCKEIISSMPEVQEQIKVWSKLNTMPSKIRFKCVSMLERKLT